MDLLARYGINLRLGRKAVGSADPLRGCQSSPSYRASNQRWSNNGMLGGYAHRWTTSVWSQVYGQPALFSEVMRSGSVESCVTPVTC